MRGSYKSQQRTCTPADLRSSPQSSTVNQVSLSLLRPGSLSLLRPCTAGEGQRPLPSGWEDQAGHERAWLSGGGGEGWVWRCGQVWAGGRSRPSVRST